MGPQETVDWLEALDNVTNRIETIETALRLRARPMSAKEEIKKQHRQYAVDLNNDVSAYTLYIKGVSKILSEHIDNKAGAIEQIVHGTVNDNLNMLSQKSDVVEAGFASLMAFVNSAWST